MDVAQVVKCSTYLIKYVLPESLRKLLLFQKSNMARFKKRGETKPSEKSEKKTKQVVESDVQNDSGRRYGTRGKRVAIPETMKKTRRGATPDTPIKKPPPKKPPPRKSPGKKAPPKTTQKVAKRVVNQKVSAIVFSSEEGDDTDKGAPGFNLNSDEVRALLKVFKANGIGNLVVDFFYTEE